MNNLSTTRGYRTLARRANCINTNYIDDATGERALYVGLADRWGMWFSPAGAGAVEDDATMPDAAPAAVRDAAIRYAARLFA